MTNLGVRFRSSLGTVVVPATSKGDYAMMEIRLRVLQSYFL